MVGGGLVEAIQSKGCSKLLLGFSSPMNSFRGLHKPVEPMSPASSSLGSDRLILRSASPFLGLVICVTGLSKEARKQVMEATERLGGQYSPHLHPHCTHLVVQSFGGRKFEHALKHGARHDLFVVTLGWFVDSVRKNVRLSESLYSVKSFGENAAPLDDYNRITGYSGAENSCLPVGVRGIKQSHLIHVPHAHFAGTNCDRSCESALSGQSMYVDLNISAELRNKIVAVASKEGATFVDQWFVGCHASHVVCEGSSIRKYLGHSSNLVTPLWVLKTAKEKYMQRLVHMSADLARQVSLMLEDLQSGIPGEALKTRNTSEDAPNLINYKTNREERLQIVNSAKLGVRNRRSKKMQTCQTPIRPITPVNLLDSICWSISEPTSTASIYTDSFSTEDASQNQTPDFFDVKIDSKDSEASFAHLTRSLTESEKSEVIFRNIFLTLLLPVDRFSEIGPSSRTFFSEAGFTCLQVLDHIYAFYQENMSVHEIEVAIHTDSRHADRLRAAYSGAEAADQGFTVFKRIDFVGSRRSFEMLKRVSGDNNCNVYELLIRA